MCGIAGIWSDSSVQPSQLRNLSNSFLEALRHRGPNDSGSYIDSKLSLALCHTRLSILDLSSEGHQPKHSLSRRFTIIFNGEIYNHQFLRSICSKSITFTGTSDTETILALIDEFGFSDTLQLLDGMFALAVWDSVTETLFLARDRFGEKPLYWGYINLFDSRTLCFSSDLDAIFSTNPLSLSDLDLDSVHHYFTYGFIPNHKSIHKSFSQVLPGTFLSFTKNISIRDPKSTTYWSAKSQLSQERLHFNRSFQTAVTQLDGLLTQSVSSKLISDVPVGCFLSGGIDSSLIASIYSSISDRPITTLNLSFPDSDDQFFDEGSYASSVANYLGSNHFKLELSSSSVIFNISAILSSYSEPFSDLSQLPTYLISEYASQLGLKVVLSGDGGDELFGGYNRHVFAHFYRKSGLQNHSLISHCLSYLLQFTPTSSADLSRNSLIKLVGALSVDSNPYDIYNSLLKRIDSSDLVNFKSTYPSSHFLDKTPFCSDVFDANLTNLDLAHVFMLFDTQFYLPADILTKVDRASMANSLEIRSPFLDIDLFNFAWSLPTDFLFSSKNCSLSGKYILRSLLSGYLPKCITKRPKHGFSVPMANWLRGPLKVWACELLDPSEINRLGLLNSFYISRILSEHLSGDFDHSNILWSIIVWQFWSTRYITS